MRTELKKRSIWIMVAIITTLLAIHFVFSYRNSQTIDINILNRREAQRVKVSTLEIIRSLHELDMGLRGFALIPDKKMTDPYDVGLARIDSAFLVLEPALRKQNFEMDKFYALRDSIQSYFVLTNHMLELLKNGNQDEFIKILDADRGYNVWLQYQAFETSVYNFEDAIIAIADKNYQAALSRNYISIIVLITLIIPTLIYTALKTNKNYEVSEQLILSQEENNALLQNQNEKLEYMVEERTEEIATQNEEIQSNLEAISKRNGELEEAKKVIEQKNRIIEARNKGLGFEVEKQTQNLKQSNQELIRNINQLEQFSYTVSHNLRAPVARLMGLTEILKYAQDEKATSDIHDKIKQASHDLDKILRDLVLTIEIKKEINNALVELDIDLIINKTIKSFEDEVKKNQIVLKVVSEVKRLKSIAAYLESIFYNLLSNAIKYRHPSRPLKIELSTQYFDNFIELRVKDNGMGIDLERNNKDLFNFYKRFHFHVEGRGLGLFLVKSQVELLGGTIRVESEVDIGTTFIIRLRNNPESTETEL